MWHALLLPAEANISLPAIAVVCLVVDDDEFFLPARSRVTRRTNWSGVSTNGSDCPFLAACGAHLRAVIEAQLETCSRPGELLSLQWSQVDWERNELFLPSEKTKSGKLRKDGSGDRWIPMTQRLRAILEMRKLDRDRKEWAGDRYVFGNEAGERIKSVRTAFRQSCRRAGSSVYKCAIYVGRRARPFWRVTSRHTRSRKSSGSHFVHFSICTPARFFL